MPYFWVLWGSTVRRGEVSEILKKHLIHGDDLDRDHLRQELGDVCWYLLHTMNTFGFTFNEVIEANVVKLCDRHYPKNGDPEDWINPFGPDLGNI